MLKLLVLKTGVEYSTCNVVHFAESNNKYAVRGGKMSPKIPCPNTFYTGVLGVKETNHRCCSFTGTTPVYQQHTVTSKT